MAAIQTIDFLFHVLTIAANCVVAGFCLIAYRRTRITPLLLIGISACLAVFTLFCQTILFSRVGDPAKLEIFGLVLTGFWAADIILYAVGVCQLAQKIPQWLGVPKPEDP